MKQIIKDLYKFNRCLIGEGYDQALDYINKILPLKIIGIRSGTKVADWTIPPEWVIKDAWVKFKGEKILDVKLNPLCVTVASLPINKKVTLQELKEHLHTSDECADAYFYDYRFYDREWGFTMPKNMVTKLEEGEYEVFIDSEDKVGTMKIGIHTIKGKSDREILLFAHLDHPYQANDNLSAVACLIDMAKDIKCDHTVKLIFCPETIGSIAYATKMDISNVDFVLSIDSIGNDNTLLFQKAFDKENRLNDIMHLAVSNQGVSYRKGDFRMIAGADEYYFNDPRVGIPGIFLTRLPFNEYHTADDVPEKILIDKIKEVQKVVLKTIEYYEKDFIPNRSFKGPIMRSKHGIQTIHKSLNLNMDYLFYDIDGKKYLSELIMPLGIGFDYAYGVLEPLIKEKLISKNEYISVDSSKIKKSKVGGKKH